MRLFNLEGSAIFGPGSEWFWSMASFVVVVVSLGGIYYQLRLARSANAFEQMHELVRVWDSERMTRRKLEILLELVSGRDWSLVPRLAILRTRQAFDVPTEAQVEQSPALGPR